MPIVRSRGVTIFGYLLVVSSLYQMAVLVEGGYVYYSYLHQQYSPPVILLRYIVSWVIKIAGLAAGIGVLKLKDFFRKLAILGSIFTVCTVNLKHTYAAYSLHTQQLDIMAARMGLNMPVTFSSLTWPALILQRAIDIIFGLLLVYFFTRPPVHKQFRS